MYLMFADEADQDGSNKQFLVYGAIYIPCERVAALNKAISLARSEVGLGPYDQLKFSPGTVSKKIDRRQHADLKARLLGIAAEHEVSATCYVVFNDIARGQDLATRLKWAVNTLCANFDKFLQRDSNSAGLAFFDRTTDYKQEKYFIELMAEGCPKYSGGHIRLRNIVGINSTQDGLGHLNSLCDIVVGSFRFVFNEPDKDVVGKALFKQLAKLLWGPTSADGKTWYVLENGLILRPKKIEVAGYEADRNATIEMLKAYHFEA